MPAPTLEAWAEIRFAYEHTSRTVDNICAAYGISPGTLRDRMKRWNWRRRQPLVPKEGPPGMEAVACPLTLAPVALPITEPAPATPLQHADASRTDPPRRHSAFMAEGGTEEAGTPSSGTLEDPAATVARLQSAVSRVMPAIEAVIFRLTDRAHSPREIERATRTLGMLTRTLRELNGLLEQYNVQAAKKAAQEYDDVPEDLDTYRIELTRRIETFLASRAAEGTEDWGSRAEEAKPAETC